MTVRLNKFLSECGISSRRKVEELILQGRVDVNGKTVVELAFRVDPEKDVIELDGERQKPNPKAYYVLNKPKGYITSTDDEKGRKTVMELIKSKDKLFPVGRLDYNTTGVLLITNDGDFANILLHPGNKVPRIYQAEISRPLSEGDRLKLTKGVYIDGKRGRFSDISYPKRNNFSVVQVTTIEGRNHFVKNMFKSLGYNVLELTRISYAGLTAQGLTPGKYKALTMNEINSITNKYVKK